MRSSRDQYVYRGGGAKSGREGWIAEILKWAGFDKNKSTFSYGDNETI